MQIFTGKVIAKHDEKTAKVEIVRLMAHPVYKKRLKRTKNYLVHDELGVKVGDKVRFIACKPISKTKHWKIAEVINAKKQIAKKTTAKKELANKKTVKKNIKKEKK